VHFKLRAAAIDHRGNDDVSLYQPSDGSRQNIARAQTVWLLRCQQEIAGANAYAQMRTNLGSN